MYLEDKDLPISFISIVQGMEQIEKRVSGWATAALISIKLYRYQGTENRKWWKTLARSELQNSGEWIFLHAVNKYQNIIEDNKFIFKKIQTQGE